MPVIPVSVLWRDPLQVRIVPPLPFLGRFFRLGTPDDVRRRSLRRCMLDRTAFGGNVLRPLGRHLAPQLGADRLAAGAPARPAGHLGAVVRVAAEARPTAMMWQANRHPSFSIRAPST